MNREETALEYRKNGYTCSQAVICAFTDLLDMDEDVLFKISEGLGFGNSDSLGTCGAVSAMALIIGLLKSSGNLDHPDSKAATYKIVRELNQKFREKNGSTICHDLKGMETGKILRSCSGCVKDAVKLLEKELDV